MTKLKCSDEIIFYLKLRHNNLPILQDFLFLGLVIRISPSTTAALYCRRVFKKFSG
jgi:hypothetical protein